MGPQLRFGPGRSARPARRLPGAAIYVLALAAALGNGLARAEPSAQASPSQVTNFALADQQGRLHKYHFPKTKLSLVTVADQKGSTQIESWIRPVRQRYETTIDIDGIADVSAVPVLLRGVVTRRFRKGLDYPVMLDWTGAVCRQFAHVKGQVNVYLLDREGRVLHRQNGPASEEALRALYAELDRAKP